MDAEAYALSIYATASRLEAGGKIGPESSTNKIFWSELDVALHHTALEILGQRAELLGQTHRTAATSATGSTVTSSPWPDRSTPARTKSSATSSPSGCSACRGPKPMHFAFTEDQLTHRPTPRARCWSKPARPPICAGCSTAASRATRRAGRRSSEMGLLGMLAPEKRRRAGHGAWPISSAIAEAAGYVALPEPLVELAGVTIPLLARPGGQSRLARRALGGSIIALGHPLNPFVADADSAVALLLGDGDDVHLVERGDVTLDARSKASILSAACSRVDWTPSPADPRRPGWGDTADRGALLAAAQLIGLAQRCIDLAVAYAKDRTQFGKPIGSYPGSQAHDCLGAGQGRVRAARGARRRRRSCRSAAWPRAPARATPRSPPAKPPTLRRAWRCRPTARWG